MDRKTLSSWSFLNFFFRRLSSGSPLANHMAVSSTYKRLDIENACNISTVFRVGINRSSLDIDFHCCNRASDFVRTQIKRIQCIS